MSDRIQEPVSDLSEVKESTGGKIEAWEGPPQTSNNNITEKIDSLEDELFIED